MKLHRLLPLLLLSLVTAVHAADAPPATAASDAAKWPLKKILFFTKSVDYEHTPIAMRGGEPSFAMQILKPLGEKNNIEFTESKDASLFSDEYLAKFDGLMFYTQDGQTQLNRVGRQDGAPAMTAAGKEALLKAVNGGKAFIAMHSASDTFHSIAPGATRANYYVADGDHADPYIKMLGGEFIAHGNQQKGHQIVVDAKFPGIAALPPDFGPNEEWYTMKNFSPDLHVILMQDTAGMTGADYMRPPYPSTWARMQGKGRVFYTSMGHREDLWQSEPFQAVLLGGINWAIGRVDADVTPNIDKVAPKANQLQAAPQRGGRGGRRGGGPAGPAGAPGMFPGAPGMTPGAAPGMTPGAAPVTPPAAAPAAQ